MLRAESHGTAAGAAAQNAGERTLLLVDDEKMLLLTLSYALKHHDPSLRVLTADDGRSACRLLEEEAVDLVVTDLYMPGMDGFALIRFLSERYPNTPVIAMTGASLQDVKPQLSALGVSVCLEKSGDFFTLIKSMADALGPDTLTATATA